VENILFQGLGLAASSEEPAGAGMLALNGRRGPVDGRARAVTSRREDGLLDVLGAGKELVQTFKCNEPNLAAIAVRAASHEQANSYSLELALYQHDAPAPIQRLRQSVLEATENGWVIFRFPALVDSAGRDYRFVLSSPDARPGNGCAVYHARESLYGSGKLQANGRAAKGSLVFQTFVERLDADEMRKLIRPEQASYAPANGGSGGQRVGGGADSPGSPQLREEIRSLGKRLERMEQRQAEASRRLTDLHNFWGAVRSTLPYRAARQIARTLRLTRR
jgi:hypothetical protein